MKRVLLVVLLVGCGKVTAPIDEPPERTGAEAWAASLYYPAARRPLVMVLLPDGSAAWHDSSATIEAEATWRKVDSAYLILLFTPTSTISLSMRRADSNMVGTFYEDGPVDEGGTAQAFLR